MTQPLEDGFNDVLCKAQFGLGLGDGALAAAAGITLEVLQALRQGELHKAELLLLAPALHLDGPALLLLAESAWHPAKVTLTGLEGFTTTYGDMAVNAYLVYDPATSEAAVFDTGASAAGIAARVRELGLNLRRLFLTHTHADHVADITGVGAPEVWVSEREPHPGASTFTPGATWQLGELRIEARSTWGHSKGGTTFVVEGLARPLAIVGDALFAGSMGGAKVSYADALATNRREIFSLPDATVLAPGHGPLTSVGEEKIHNPFFPELK
jgi:glyoxylase-like metal-dependent hydrolase (beta-lactamase superfamily II)